MAQAHQQMSQIVISLAQMVHFGWEQPLIIVDFGISKIALTTTQNQQLEERLKVFSGRQKMHKHRSS